MDKITENALKIGRAHAKDVLVIRAKVLESRMRSPGLQDQSIVQPVQPADGEQQAAILRTISPPPGVLVAEGDSWFNYPLHDVVHELEDQHEYDVVSVAHYGDLIEGMAYEKGQLLELARQIEKLMRRNIIPKAVLLSGGGNDVAGTEFGMLLNHAQSAVPGFNLNVVEGVINERIRTAYITILSEITGICEGKIGKTIPILVHGYDYPVPDGRGFLGGAPFFPGPWLEPGFRTKGYHDLPGRIRLARDLIDRFNTMVQGIAGLEPFAHVHYIDLRNTLQTGPKYETWWDNELHPTVKGFRAIADKFATALAAL